MEKAKLGEGGAITLKFLGKGDALNLATFCLVLGGGAEPSSNAVFNVFPVR